MSEERNTQNPPGQNSETAPEAVEPNDVQALQEQLEKSKNDFLYLRAEFENYKRNAIKERSDLVKYGSERIVRDLLEVVDNFERALDVKVNEENFNTFKQGVEMTAAEMRTLLQKHNVIEVPSYGEAFNPMVHEALSSEVSDQVPEGHISRVFKKPYRMHDKVIRTGQVVVARKPE